MSLTGNAQKKHEVKQIQQAFLDCTSVSTLTPNGHDREGFKLNTSNNGLQQISGEDGRETLVGLPKLSHTVLKKSPAQYKER